MKTNFKLTHKLPSKCFVAVSGGVDSMTALHWLNRVKGRIKGVAHFHHNTGEFADESCELVRSTAQQMELPFFVHYNFGKPDKGESLEDYWRTQRYLWFKKLSRQYKDMPVVLAHTLDDCLEEYVMCTMVRGFSGTIPYTHGPCIRPFRRWKKESIRAYAHLNEVDYLEDPSNDWDWAFKRAYIRHNIVPNLFKINPGIYKMAEKAIEEQDKREHMGL